MEETMAKISTKGIWKKHSRTARNNESGFIQDAKIEYITSVHGRNHVDRIDPHAEGMQICPKTTKIRGREPRGDEDG